jgi:hypothetical protein
MILCHDDDDDDNNDDDDDDDDDDGDGESGISNATVCRFLSVDIRNSNLKKIDDIPTIFLNQCRWMSVEETCVYMCRWIHR